jgi:hypothetical protein
MWIVMPLHDDDDLPVGNILVNQDVKSLEILADNCGIDLSVYC